MNPDLKVGIFWIVNGDIIADAIPLSHANEYGKAIEYGGHWEYWERLVPLTRGQYLLKSHEYDRYPRGRVVYFPAQRSVVVYADQCLWTSEYRTKLQEVFGINQAFRFTSDDHYRCLACGGSQV